MQKITGKIMILAMVLVLSSCHEDQMVIFEHPLQALESDPGSWHWTDVEGMICRDGSNTGIGVRIGSEKKKWVVYLMGGGACFTPETCADNPSSYSGSLFDDQVGRNFYDAGLLDYDREENPVKGWSTVFVPYCTGDVHSGNNEDSYGLGLTEPQQFVGYRNITYVLEFLAPYLEHNKVDEIMITGISAGGFGTHLAYWQFKKRFPDVKMNLINDSGPLASDPELFPLCLLGFQLIYDIPLPSGFLFCCQPFYGLADVYTLFSRYYPDDNYGIMSYYEDNTIRYFYAAGQNTCTGGTVSGALYKQGLIHLRENVLIPAGNWSTYFVEGDGHTFIQGNNFYNVEAGGIKLYEWVSKVINGEVIQVE